MVIIKGLEKLKQNARMRRNLYSIYQYILLDVFSRLARDYFYFYPRVVIGWNS